MEQSIQRSFFCAKSAVTKSVMVLVGNSACQQRKSFFNKHLMKAGGYYYWNILLSQKCYLLSLYCNKNFFWKTAYHCIVHATLLNCCSKKNFSILLLLSYAPNYAVLNSIDYKISRFILQYEHKL